MLIFSSLDLKNYLLKLHHSPENGCDPVFVINGTMFICFLKDFTNEYFSTLNPVMPINLMKEKTKI